MNVAELTSLIVSITGLVSALGAAAAAIIVAVRGGKKQAKKAEDAEAEANTLGQGEDPTNGLDMEDLQKIAEFIGKLQGGS